EPLHRVADLHAHLQPAPERLVQARDPRAATDRIDAREAGRRAGRGGEERGRPLDADGELFSARLDVWRQVRAVRLALDRLLGILSRQALLPLQVFPKPPRPDGDAP